jgi:hypothetical protein
MLQIFVRVIPEHHMRPRPQRGQDWRKGGDYTPYNGFSTEQKKISRVNTFRERYKKLSAQKNIKNSRTENFFVGEIIPA